MAYSWIFVSGEARFVSRGLPRTEGWNGAAAFGALPNSMTIDEIGERQFSRNELICTCLARCPLTERFTDIVRSRIMDRRGEGVPVIFSASGKLSGKCPKYELLGDSELKLTIFAAPADDPKALRKIAANLSSRDLHSVNEFTDLPTLDKIKARIRANPSPRPLSVFAGSPAARRQ